MAHAGQTLLDGYTASFYNAFFTAFPIGIFSGSVSELTLLLCGDGITNIKWDWCCKCVLQ